MEDAIMVHGAFYSAIFLPIGPFCGVFPDQPTRLFTPASKHFFRVSKVIGYR